MAECRWLKPQLVAQIEYADWTDVNHLRHTKFIALRDDKPAKEVLPRAAGRLARVNRDHLGTGRFLYHSVFVLLEHEGRKKHCLLNNRG
jgi:hypothetical protein